MRDSNEKNRSENVNAGKNGDDTFPKSSRIEGTNRRKAISHGIREL
jgi:hypothetical protein